MTESETSDLKIGLIGFGEVGSTLTRGWREANPALAVAAFDVAWSEKRRSQANDLGVQFASSLSELVGQSSMVICAVVPQAARDAAAQAAPFLGSGHLYVDLTSSGPAKACEVAALVGARGARFAKLALMGAVASFGYRVPCVASGPGARVLADHLVPLGMKVEVLNDDPGAAATLKLCRSLFMKGYVALAVETLRVARKNGVQDEVVASLADTWETEGFQPALKRLVCSSVTHASRRAAELDEAIESFQELGFGLPVARASRQVFEELIALQSSEPFKEESPKDIEAVLKALP